MAALIEIDPDFSPFDEEEKALKGPFKIIKAPRRRKVGRKSSTKGSTNLARCNDYENFNQ